MVLNRKIFLLFYFLVTNVNGLVVSEWMDDNQGMEMPTVQEILEARTLDTDEEAHMFAMKFYWTHLLPAVGGMKRWKVHMYYIHLSGTARVDGIENHTLLTVSDEAFALVLYDNCHDKWLREKDEDGEQTASDDGKNTKRNKRSPGKYTQPKSGSELGARWSDEGKRAYNEYYRAVKEARENDPGFGKEKKFLKWLQEEEGIEESEPK